MRVTKNLLWTILLWVPCTLRITYMMRTDAYMKRTCYSIAHTAWLDCLIDDDDGDDALNAIDEISVKNKLYRTQKLFRTPNVDEYTTILSEISMDCVRSSSSLSSSRNRKQSFVFVAFVLLHRHTDAYFIISFKQERRWCTERFARRYIPRWQRALLSLPRRR